MTVVVGGLHPAITTSSSMAHPNQFHKSSLSDSLPASRLDQIVATIASSQTTPIPVSVLKDIERLREIVVNGLHATVRPPGVPQQDDLALQDSTSRSPLQRLLAGRPGISQKPVISLPVKPNTGPSAGLPAKSTGSLNTTPTTKDHDDVAPIHSSSSAQRRQDRSGSPPPSLQPSLQRRERSRSPFRRSSSREQSHPEGWASRIDPPLIPQGRKHLYDSYVPEERVQSARATWRDSPERSDERRGNGDSDWESARQRAARPALYSVPRRTSPTAGAVYRSPSPKSSRQFGSDPAETYRRSSPMSAPALRFDQREYRPFPTARYDPEPSYRTSNEYLDTAPPQPSLLPPAPPPLPPFPEYRPSPPPFDPLRSVYPAPPLTNPPAWNRPSPYDERRLIDRNSGPSRSLPPSAPTAPTVRPAPTRHSIVDAQIAELKAKAAWLKKVRADQERDAEIARRYPPRPESPPPRFSSGSSRDEYNPHNPSSIVRVPYLPPPPPAAAPPAPPSFRPPPFPAQQRWDYDDRYQPRDRY